MTQSSEESPILGDRLASFALVAVTTMAAAFTVLVAGGFGHPEFRIAYIAIAVVAIVPLLVFSALRGRGMPSTRLAPAIWACIAAFGISTLTSRVPRVSLEMFAYVLLLAGLYVAAVALMRRPVMRAHVARLALVLCTIVGVLYVVQVVEGWLAWWDVVGRLTLPPLRPAYAGLNLGSPNPVAALVLLLLAFTVASAPLQRRSGALFVTFLVALALIAVFLTASRGAWLGAAAAIPVTGMAALITSADARRVGTRFIRSKRGAIAAVGVGVLALVAVMLAGVSGRLTIVDAGREAFTTSSLRMFESSPVTGTGSGTWPVLRASFTAAGEIDAYVPHAHSIYTQSLAELGLLGILAGIVMMVGVGGLIVRALASTDVARRRVALATVSVLVLLAVHQTVDMFMNIPPILFAAALPIAWLDATADTQAAEPDGERTSRAGLRSRGFPLTAAIAFVVIAVGLFRIEGIAIDHRSAVVASDAGDWPEALRLARLVAEADPDVPAYQFTLGVAAANAGDLQLSEAALLLAAEADDYPYAWLDLAAVRWQIGDLLGASAALRNAERLGIQRPTVSLPAGWLRQRLADDPAAIEDYAAALLGTPTLAADPFWTSAGELRSVWPDVWEAVQAEAGPRTRLVLALTANRTDLAAEAVTILSQDDPDLYGNVVGAWNGDAAAWTTLQALAEARPTDGVTLEWCQLIAEHRGDREAIDRFVRWIALLGSPALARPMSASVGSATAPITGPSVFDGYELLYRRQVPAAQVAGILPQITFRAP